MKMRILFVFTNVNTPFRSVYPNGIGSLTAFLKKYGFQIKVFVLNKSRHLSGLKKVLQEYQPHLVGFSGASSQFPYIDKMARLVKQWKDIPVICGGFHAMLVPEEILNTSVIDAVCVGEGEKAVLEYAEALRDNRDHKNTKGIWFKYKGEIIKNDYQEFIQDLDSLPFADRSIMDYQEDIDENMGTIFLVAGKGCSYNQCAFCSNPTFSRRGKGTYARMRSADNVLGEIAQLEEKYKFEHIYFRDDTFTWNRQWALEFCRKYGERFKYPFDILTHAECLDRDLTDSLKKANCCCVWVGIDSGNDYIRNKVLKKTAAKEKIIEVCDDLHSAGIKVMTTNMVGLPYETPVLFQDTIDLNKRIYRSNLSFSQASGIGPNIFVFGPFPGTEAYRICERENWLKPMPYGYRVYKRSFLDMPGFPKRKIQCLFRSFRYQVYKDTHLFEALLCLFWDSWLGEKILTFFPRKLLKRVGYCVSKWVRKNKN